MVVVELGCCEGESINISSKNLKTCSNKSELFKTFEHESLSIEIY